MKTKNIDQDTRFFTLGEYAEKFEHSLSDISLFTARVLTRVAEDLSLEHRAEIRIKKGAGIRKGREAKKFEKHILDMAVIKLNSLSQ